MAKYRVGYTTGVFDLFHIGHLEILRKSKELCDILIVGVSTDELTKKYKGNFPIIKYEERAKIVEAIRYVDRVVPQENMDKKEAWKKYHYDVLFHGDDWENTSMYKENERILKECGVNIVYFPHTEGVSSTEIKKTLKERKRSCFQI